MDAVKQVLKLSGLKGLNPVQKKAISAGLLKGENLVVASPTASGKTVIAEIAALRKIKEGKKVVYIVPLRALASEKYKEFKEKYTKLGIKVAISTGDMDSSDHWLAGYDLIVVSSEKFDSLMRHGIPWIGDIGLVVADEIHLLDSPERGPTLEVVLTRLNQSVSPEVLALSATINNYKELAQWLNAKPIKSDYRPVRLYTGVCWENKVNFLPKMEMLLNPEFSSLESIIDDTISKNKQALIFISTRRGSESAAEKIGKFIKNRLKQNEVKSLAALADKAFGALEHPTKQCEKLSDCIRFGTAFHHAGLVSKQRDLIENAFRDGLIKIVTATPTLAFGLNLPSWRVVVRDMKRYSSFRGMDYIPVLEIQQMLGRAGRPKYDREGQAILVPKNKGEAEYAWENYIKGEPEKITSKLGVEPVLRMHVLALIAGGVTTTKKALLDFFSKTFWAFQYKDFGQLEKIIERVLALLENFKFIRGDKMEDQFRPASDILNAQELKPTRIGKRVSELYIDPLTANHLIKNMEAASKGGINNFGYLHIISNCLEMKPGISIRKGDFENLNDLIAREEQNITMGVPNEWDLEYEEFLKSLKTAWLFSEWIEEMGEDMILTKFGVTPGELRARLEIADWLLYSAQELALLLGFKNILKEVRKLRIRVKYGVREELLPLIRLKGIGRVRSRKLYAAGIKRLADLRKIPLASLERIIPPKVARDIKGQLGD